MGLYLVGLYYKNVWYASQGLWRYSYHGNNTKCYWRTLYKLVQLYIVLSYMQVGFKHNAKNHNLKLIFHFVLNEWSGGWGVKLGSVRAILKLDVDYFPRMISIYCRFFSSDTMLVSKASEITWSKRHFCSLRAILRKERCCS